MARLVAAPIHMMVWAAFLLAGCAAVQDGAAPPRCDAGVPSFAEFDREMWEMSALTAFARRDLDDGERVNFLAAFNATPPQTDVRADAIHLYVRAGVPRVLVVFVNQGCVLDTRFPPGLIVHLWLSGQAPLAPQGPGT